MRHNMSRGTSRRALLSALVGGVAGSAILALAGCTPAPVAPTPPGSPPSTAPTAPSAETPVPTSPTAAPPAATPTQAAASPTAAAASATPALTPSPAPTAAASPQASPTTQATPSPSAQTVLRLATNHAAVEAPWIRKVLDTFARENPTLRVEPTNVTTRYLEQVASWGAEGKLPDVLFVRSAHAAALAYKRWIATIDDLVGRDAQAIDLADFHPQQVEELKLDGKWLLLPYDYTVQILYSRADAFAEVGSSPSDDWTWAALASAAKVATRKDAAGTRWGFSWLPDSSALPGLWLAEAGKLRRDDGRGIAVSSPEHVQATQWQADLAIVEGCAPKPGEVGPGALVAGKLAAEVNGSWAAATYRGTTGKIVATALPKGQAGRRASYGTGSGWALSQGTKLRDGAWQLLRHLSSRDSLEILVALPLRNLPGRISATALWQAGVEALGVPERPAAIAQTATEGFGHQQAVWWLSYQDVYGELMPRVWTGERKASEVLPELERRVNAAAARYYA